MSSDQLDKSIDSEVIEIVPLEEYDSRQAKLKASLSWILHKTYGNDVPADFLQPFYETSQGQLQLKPRLMNLMSTSELYCTACNNMFGDKSSQWQVQGHWSIIQVLSRKGIYIECADGNVTETVLVQMAPFKVTAHVALIDALMKAFSTEVLSIEKVVGAVRKITSFNASTELPSTLEDTAVFWLNKVCCALSEKLDKAQSAQVIEGESNLKVRIVSKSTTPRDNVCIPLIKDLLKDIGDGCSLASVISFYFPSLLKIEDVCLKANIGIADSLYNLRLVQKFCESHLKAKVFLLGYEDLLYTHTSMNQNVLVFVAELFKLFELDNQEGIQILKGQEKETSEGVPNSAKRLPSPSVPQISSVTKRSFLRPHMSDTRTSSSHSEFNKTSPTSTLPPSKHSMLNKRNSKSEPHKGRRSQSLSSPQERVSLQHSIHAWEDHHIDDRELEPELVALMSPGSSNSSEVAGISEPVKNRKLLDNVSIDEDNNESFFDAQDYSLNLGELDSVDLSKSPRQIPSNIRDPAHPDYMEVQSVSSGRQQSSLSSNAVNEPLLPAKLKPSKERINNHTKQEERDEVSDKRKVITPTRSMKQQVNDKRDSPAASESSVDDVIVTPLPDEQLSMSMRSSDSIGTLDSSPEHHARREYDKHVPNQGISESFSHLVPQDSELDPSQSRQGTARSFIASHQVRTSDNARALGIPVVSDLPQGESQQQSSRQGSVASMTSSRSSGEFSDAELQKLYKDNRGRESKKMEDSFYMSEKRGSPDISRPESLLIIQPPGQKDVQKYCVDDLTKGPRTNFAELKRLKEVHGKIDNSALVYMQNDQEQNDSNSRDSALKSAFLKNKVDKAQKKTSFASLPNQTTWQQTALQNTNSNSSSANDEMPPSSDLTQIRLKLEEKRRMIERKKKRVEAQQQKLRQRLGKAAFFRVLSNQTGPEGGDIGSGEIDGVDASGVQRKPFSREGIQQTIENVRKKWFNDDSNSQATVQEVAALPVDDEKPKELPPFTSEIRRSASESPKPIDIENIDEMQLSDEMSSSTEQDKSADDYNSSLDKLNRNLNDLQGEIQRLSLQQEQMKFLAVKNRQPQTVLSPPSSQGENRVQHEQKPSASYRLHNGNTSQENYSLTAISNDLNSFRQVPFSHTSDAPSQMVQSFHEFSSPSVPSNFPEPSVFSKSAEGLDSEVLRRSSLEENRRLSVETQENDQMAADQENGFFVSFGPGDTPKRPKPVLGKDRLKRDIKSDTRKNSTEMEVSKPNFSEDIRLQPEITPPANMDTSGSGFMVEINEMDKSQSPDLMMQKKEKILHQQMKRREEAERKRLEKDAEYERKKELERMKQEETERKKFEEKMRRDQIFQQYLNKKKQQEEDEQGGTPTVERRTKDTKPRPKSMFVKSKGSAHSQALQDATDSVAGPPGNKARLSRLTPPTAGKMKKAVSCTNIGPENGERNLAHGGLTHRRPPSPDMYNRLTQRKATKSNESSESGSNAGSEYVGPKLYVKPTSKSNRHIIMNAISHCCLAGCVNTELKNKVLEEIQRSETKHFVILFRDGQCQYRGLYGYYPESEDVIKLLGIGPRQITNAMIEKFYKYNCGAKSFSEVKSTKHLSVSIDAVVLLNYLWKTSKPTQKTKKSLY